MNLCSDYFTDDKRMIIIISLEEDRLISSQNIVDIHLDKMYVFGIFGNYNSSMKKLCKDYIEISNGDNKQYIGKVCGAMYIVDVIYSMFLSKQ